MILKRVRGDAAQVSGTEQWAIQPSFLYVCVPGQRIHTPAGIRGADFREKLRHGLPVRGIPEKRFRIIRKRQQVRICTSVLFQPGGKHPVLSCGSPLLYKYSFSTAFTGQTRQQFPQKYRPFLSTVQIQRYGCHFAGLPGYQALSFAHFLRCIDCTRTWGRRKVRTMLWHSYPEVTKSEASAFRTDFAPLIRSMMNDRLHRAAFKTASAGGGNAPSGFDRPSPPQWPPRGKRPGRCRSQYALRKFEILSGGCSCSPRCSFSGKWD